MSTAIAAWLGRHENPEDTERRQHNARSLTWRTDPDGMVVGTFRLPPQMAAILIAAVTAWVMRWRPSRSTTQGGGHASAGAQPPPAVADWPTIPQQQADALIDLIDNGGAHITTEVVVHVRGDGCTFDDGTPIAGSIVERDQGCVDCGATQYLEQDHDREFATSNHTVIDELKERCTTCHRARHASQRAGRSRGSQ